MATKTKRCKECNEKFNAPIKELNRGNAKFCSQSCAATWGNRTREKQSLECEACGETFKSKAGNAKFCSSNCAQALNANNGYRKRANRNSAEMKRIKRKVDRNQCYNCDWSKTTCDLCHIKPVKNGGDNTPDNLTVLCPNCHRLADNTEKLDITSVPTVADRCRTISSSQKDA